MKRRYLQDTSTYHIWIRPATWLPFLHEIALPILSVTPAQLIRLGIGQNMHSEWLCYIGLYTFLQGDSLLVHDKKHCFLFADYFQTDGKDTFCLTELQNTLECLQNDLDRDVKYFAGGDLMELVAPRHLNRQLWYTRRRTDSRDSEDQYQDAAEYLEPELSNLKGGQTHVGLSVYAYMSCVWEERLYSLILRPPPPLLWLAVRKYREGLEHAMWFMPLAYLALIISVTPQSLCMGGSWSKISCGDCCSLLSSSPTSSYVTTWLLSVRWILQYFCLHVISHSRPSLPISHFK